MERQEKIEMDQSYRNPMASTDESGVFSNENDSLKTFDTDSSWNLWENEITDPKAFMLPILHSSNLNGNENVIYCSLSSIEDLSLVSKGKQNCLQAEIKNHLGQVCNSTRINDKSNLIFGFLGESQARIYSQVNGCKGNYRGLEEDRETSSVDTDFVVKYQDSELSMLNSDLPKKEVGFPFSISNDFNTKIAIMVNNLPRMTLIAT